MTTALLLLSGSPDAIAQALPTVAPVGTTASWAGTRAADDPLADTMYGAAWPYGGFLSLEYPDGTDVQARIADVVNGLSSAIDRSKSTVIVGSTHRVIDGRTDVALAYVIHRLPHLTVEQYQHHWLHGHGPLARELVDNTGYEQTHADHAASAAVGGALGFGDEDWDGNATCFFRDRQHFVDMLEARAADTENVIYEDELRFLDHSRSLGALMRRVPLAEPA